MLPSFKILEVVAGDFNISIEDLKGTTRLKEVAQARQLAAYLLRTINKLSYPAIGKIMEKNHTTIIHSCKKITNDLAENPKFKESVRKLIVSLGDIDLSADIIETPFLAPDEIKYLNKKMLAELPAQSEKSTPIPETSEDVLKTIKNLDITEREAYILSKYRQGLTLEEIGSIFHVTRERIRQIIEKALRKELGKEAKMGFIIDVKEYINSQKDLHHRLLKFPEEKRRKLVQEIESGTSVKEALEEYRLTKGRFLKLFPQYKEMLAAELIQKKRWNRVYDRCRNCQSTKIPHAASGYCEKCYPKSFEFKEIQKRSHKKHKEERRDKLSAYAKEYAKRPEAIAKAQERINIVFYGGNRGKALMRDGYRCLNCDINEQEALRKYRRKLYVWHKDGNPKNNSLENLKTLCANCFSKKKQ
jgi:uncharacterized protein (DUF433 family)